MQKIRSILKITNSGAMLCDEYGSSAGIGLELMLGTGCLLEFELHQEATGTSALLPDYPLDELTAQKCYCALDFGCKNSDDPPLLIFSNVTLTQDTTGHTIFSVPVANSAVERIVTALKERSSTELFCELGGYNSDGDSVFAWQFKITMRSRVYLGNSSGSDTPLPDPAYYTAIQIDAMLAGLTKIDQAENIRLKDSGNFFDGGNVESALQEIGSQLEGLGEMLTSAAETAEGI